jgi:hypothetical protein
MIKKLSIVLIFIFITSNLMQQQCFCTRETIESVEVLNPATSVIPEDGKPGSIPFARTVSQRVIGHHAFSQEALDEYAIAQGFGYKTANLRELAQIVESINQTLEDRGYRNVRVRVPTFKGIPTNKIKEFLSKKGLNLNAKWQEFISFKEGIRENKYTLIKEAIEFLDALQREIIAKFTDESDYFEKDVSAIETESNANFIEKIKKETSDPLFMVRSTGKEDTETLANAGGNESIAAVEPTVKDLSFAMGTVVASYFSKKSISQRLVSIGSLSDESEKSRQLNLFFSEEPFTPVLVQLMEGEIRDGVTIGGTPIASAKVPDISVEELERAYKKIPVSGVIFTREAEGQTLGVTHIQAAYGHNEGVVNSLVPVDTFYIGPLHIVHKVIRRKPHRLIPITIGEAEKKEGKQPLRFEGNHPVMAKAATLNTHFLFALKLVADAVERYYGAPRDIEFVINKGSQTISLVQARPIVHKTGTVVPSYLKNPQKFKNRMRMTTIGAGGGLLRVITNSNQIIVDRELPKALLTYLASTEKGLIKCVVTGKMAPSTSHEATTLRSQGIPVVFVANIGDFKSAVTEIKTEKPLVIDVQREVILLPNQSEPFNDKEDIEAGWYSHPIPCQISLHRHTPLWPSIDKFERMLNAVSIPADMQAKKVTELIDDLKSCTGSVKERAKSLLATILKQIAKHKESTSSYISDEIKKEYLNIYGHAVACAFEVYKAIEQATEGRTLSVLYPIKFLEAVVRQQSPDVLEGYSYLTTLKALKEEEAAVTALTSSGVDVKTLAQDIKNYLIQLCKLTKIGFNKNVKKIWVQFVAETMVSKDLEVMRMFSTRINTLRNLGVLELWLNDDFMKYSGDRLSEFNSDFERSNVFLKTLSEKKVTIDVFDMSKWEDAENFTKVLNRFKVRIIDYFTTDDFITNYNSTGKIGKKAAIETMRCVVEAFDHSIKSITGTKGYDTDKKVDNFREMLKLFLAMLNKWLNLPHDFKKFPGGEAIPNKEVWVDLLTDQLEAMCSRTTYPFTFNSGGDKYIIDTKKDELTTYIGKIRYSMGGVEKERQREPFSVAKMALGAIGAAVNQDIVTLEEFFTIVHQSLLNLVGNLLKLTGVNKMERPEIVELVEQKLTTIVKRENYPTISVSLNGVNFESGKLKLFYNLPLGAHSCLLTIDHEFLRKVDKCSLTVFFSGQNEEMVSTEGTNTGKRWNDIKDFAEQFNSRLMLNQIAQVELFDSSITLYWDVTGLSDLRIEQIAQLVFQSASHTFADKDMFTINVDYLRKFSHSPIMNWIKTLVLVRTLVLE